MARSKVDYEDTSSVTFTVVDDPANDRVKISAIAVGAVPAFTSPVSITGSLGASTALLINPAAGHTGYLQEWQENGVSKAHIDNTGKAFFTGGADFGSAGFNTTGTVQTSGAMNATYYADSTNSGNYFGMGVAGSPTALAARGGGAFTIGPSTLFAVGVGLWGHAAPGAQPARPVTTADLIALVVAYGLSA